MFEFVFNDSVKAAMSAAGFDDRNVESLWLELDAGDIAGLPDINYRKDIIRNILAGPEGISDEMSFAELWDSNVKALGRVTEAGKSGEDVRIWWSDSPAEACGFYFAVSVLEHSNIRVTAVKLPPYFEQGENICVHDSLKSIEPKMLPVLKPLEREVSPALRRAIAHRWNEIVHENAPLRAVVNGRLISAPADFYDYTLRRHFTDGVFTVAYAIGKTMGENQLGVSDWIYAQRIRRMIESGELEVVKPDRDFYVTAVRKKV